MVTPPNPPEPAVALRKTLHWLLDLLADRVADRLIVMHELKKGLPAPPCMFLTDKARKEGISE
jgi:hypothetical protein